MLAPIIGILLFTLCYLVAALLYPGGSQANKTSIGFSWINNYWCNLLNDTAMNGQPNPARPVAIAGMFFLCITLSIFWFLFPIQTGIGKFARLTIQIAGIFSMTIDLFLFTKWHDEITNLASLFGLVATVSSFVVLYKINWYGLFAFGIINLLLVALNNYVYYTKGLIIYLPVIQKITFAAFLVWVCCINVSLYQRQKKNCAVEKNTGNPPLF
jgi:hypothetical protein